jgi:RNA polymerase sigma-70 factor (ECF subfamily)
VTKQEEVELTQAMLDGQTAAFERFVEHLRNKVFHYSWLMCGQREDAEEVAQETLFKVFESMDQLRDPGHVRSWVFRIAKNACLMKRRRSVFAPEANQELSLDTFLPASESDGQRRRIDIADWSHLPDDNLLRSELRAKLETAIVELPQIYRSVILLRDVEELSTQDTAQILGVSQDVVKARLHRARLAIRQNLDQYLKSASTTAVN